MRGVATALDLDAGLGHLQARLST